jgi:hypothetical protein
MAPPVPLDRPPGLGALATVLGRPDEVAHGDFRIALRSLAAPTGTSLLGRFCHGDPELAGRTQGLAAHEQALDPSAILAEVVHQPQGVVANVACRPVFRD